MAIGYACLVTGLNSIESFRTCTLKTYSEDKMFELIKHNLKVLLQILQYNNRNDIKLFRISSDIIPLASHEINTYKWQDIFKKELIEIGKYIKENKMRVSMHPGQYTVLNSPSEDVCRRAIDDLAYHCDFLSSLNLDNTHKIILHIGGVYNEREAAIERFKVNYLKLPQQIKNRLVIENDDKSYNITEVYAIGTQLNIPVVFDNLHHQILNDNTFDELTWIKKCSATWKNQDGKQKLHYSQQAPNKQVGSHSSFIAIDQFLKFYYNLEGLDVDIMLEVKDKNLSAVKCIHCTGQTNIKLLEKEWAKYKYIILERSHNTYKEIRSYLKNRDSCTSKEFYNLIEQALVLEATDGGYRNSFDHVWGYFKKLCTVKEKELYLKKLEQFNSSLLKAKTMKKYLYRLAIKYNQTYLLDSYYFSM